MTRSVPGTAVREPDSKGCLLAICCYAEVAPVVSAVVATTAAQIVTSPALGDFIELRFTDTGPRPDPGAGHSAAPGLIAGELASPGTDVDRNYFAVAVLDRSADVVQQLLNECRLDRVMSALPVRYRGFASIEDRAADATLNSAVIVSPTGSWSQEALAEQLIRYADELMREFAADPQPGLTHGQLDLIRLAGQTTELATPDTDRPGHDGETIDSAPVSPELDVLSLPAEDIDQADEKGVAMAGGRHRAPPSAAELPAPPAPVPPVEEPASPRLTWRRPMPNLHLRRATTPAPPAVVTDPPEEPLSSGLVYLVLTGDTGSTDRSAWRRGRSILLELDQKLAGAPQVSYQVRALQRAEDASRGELRPAGHLSGRGIKRPAEGEELGRILGAIQIAMKRDLAALERAETDIVKPAIVLFTVEAPLDDAVTAEAYSELADTASISWVVPEPAADLISAAFAEAADTRIIPDHQAVADEIVVILLNSRKDEQR